MKLSKVATYFNRVMCFDAYDQTAAPFKAQLDLFDDSKRDGVSVERRILEVAPDVQTPNRNAVNFDGQNWILGQAQADNWNGQTIRRKYNLQTCEGLATISTFLQFLAGDGVKAYADRVWSRGAKEVEISSSVFNVYEIYFGLNETSLKERTIVSLAGRHYMARAVHTTPSGFLAATADELPEPVLETAQFGARVYNPVADTWSSNPTAVPVIRIRWQEEFNYITQASTKYEHGDIHVVIALSSATPKTSDIVTMSDGDWRVLAVKTDGETWGLHMRRD